MCNSRIQINLSKKGLYNKEIKKREEVIEFVNKILFIKASINLSAFKAVIYNIYLFFLILSEK